MRALFRVLGVLGVADAVWMGLAPRRWSDFWQRVIRKVGRRAWSSRAMAASELGFSLALLLVPRRAAGKPPLLGPPPPPAHLH